jgi:hypothetical protein
MGLARSAAPVRALECHSALQRSAGAEETNRMAKTSDHTKGHKGTDRIVDPKKSAARKGVRRVILFPTEPSTIGDEKITRAIEAVMARKRQRS